MSDDLGDPVKVEERRKTALEKDRAAKEMVKAVMGMPQGRQWMHGILETCGVFRNPFDKNALTMAFQSGEMNVGQRILAQIINADEQLYLLMMKENRDG